MKVAGSDDVSDGLADGSGDRGELAAPRLKPTSFVRKVPVGDHPLNPVVPWAARRRARSGSTCSRGPNSTAVRANVGREARAP